MTLLEETTLLINNYMKCKRFVKTFKTILIKCKFIDFTFARII